MQLDRLIAFYQEMTSESVRRLPELYGTDAYFKDPFNEVRGVRAIQEIFEHMFRALEEPRFLVTESIFDATGAVLVWEFRCRMRVWSRRETQLIRGVSHLKFGADGKVNYHRDYWDTAEELYMKLPVVGALTRSLRRMIAH